MLHLRYDWRRPASWGALSLTLFLSSHDAYLAGNNSTSARLLNKQNEEIVIIHKGYINTADKISPVPFYTGK